MFYKFIPAEGKGTGVSHKQGLSQDRATVVRSRKLVIYNPGQCVGFSELLMFFGELVPKSHPFSRASPPLGVGLNCCGVLVWGFDDCGKQFGSGCDRGFPFPGFFKAEAKKSLPSSI
jgi:hypothetical protein